jgi:hypothetical protein
MLHIREEQMLILEELALEDFRRRIQAVLEERHPEWFSENKLEAIELWIRQTHAEALGTGMVSESGVADFIFGAAERVPIGGPAHADPPSDTR